MDRFLALIIRIGGLLLQAMLILLLFVAADFAYSLYNPHFDMPGFSDDDSWLLLALTGILLLHKPWHKMTMLSFLLLATLLEYFHYQYFGMLIQPISFYQAFFNSNEIFTSFIDEIEMMLIPLLIVILLATGIFKLASIEFKRKKTRIHSMTGVLIITLLFFAGIGKTWSNLQTDNGKLTNRQIKRLYPVPDKHTTVNFIRSFNYFIGGIVPAKLDGDKTERFPTLPAPEVTITTPSRNIILVIGESLRAQSLSLLGYQKNETTPYLAGIENLLAKPVIAAGVMTKTAVSALLNRLRYPGAGLQLTTQQNCLFRLASKNGFETYFYSTQTDDQLEILQNFICRKYINHYLSRDSLDSESNSNFYDGKLNKLLDNIDLNDDTNHFIVLQQRGSHSPYRAQYPKTFAQFQKHYDNTVLFTDFVLSQMIEGLKKRTHKETYFIFTSDHGELLGEHGKWGHGWFYPEVYRVPFLFYAINPEPKVLQKANSVRSHFEISNLLASLLGYRVKPEHPEKIYVNGSDIDGLAGFLEVTLDKQGQLLLTKEIH